MGRMLIICDIFVFYHLRVTNRLRNLVNGAKNKIAPLFQELDPFIPGLCVKDLV